MRRYDYVIFNNVGSHYLLPGDDDYYTICLKDLEQSDYVQIVPILLHNRPTILRFIFALHNSDRIAKFIRLPLKKFWYPLYFKNKFNDNKPLCFVILNHKLPVSYLEYLKKKYPGCKIVMVHRDFLKVSRSMNPELPQNPILDLEMTFDEGESEKYGFPHFSEFESKIEIPVEYPFESDVFFAGSAKGRLPVLIEIYHKLAKEGLKIYFYITGVAENEKEVLPGVVYANRFMKYRDMLYHTINTRCLLEVVQPGGQEGYTSRFLESIIYGKKLLTNHEYIKQSKYYIPSNIQIINQVSDIDVDFIKNGPGFVDYNYHGEFSPFTFIDRIEEEINKIG